MRPPAPPCNRGQQQADAAKHVFGRREARGGRPCIGVCGSMPAWAKARDAAHGEKENGLLSPAGEKASTATAPARRIAHTAFMARM